MKSKSPKHLRFFYFTIAVITLILFTKDDLAAQRYLPNDNLIVNGDFMARDNFQRPLHWMTGLDMQTATISNQERHSNRKDDLSLRISDTSAFGNTLIRTKKMIAVVGVAYSLTAWANVKTGDPANLYLEFWDQNDRRIKYKMATPLTDTTWQSLHITETAPDSAVYMTVAIATTIAGRGISFWDDVFLKQNRVYDKKVEKGRHEMFMDDYRIESMVDVQRVVHRGIKSKVLIKATKPWEGRSVYIYGTVLHGSPKGSGYRMWYTAYVDKKYFLCYATSKDGINWVKPDLAIIEFNGNKKNNICLEGGGTLVYDPYDKDPQKRYKLMKFDPAKDRFGYNVYFSEDGLRWNDTHKQPVLPYGDVSNLAFDTSRKIFIATTKQRMLLSNTSVTQGKNDRTANVSISKDFINWYAPGSEGSKYSLAVEGDYLDDLTVIAKGGMESNIYGMPVYPYQGIYVGFPWMFDIATYAVGEFSVTGDGKIQPQVAVSRDLKIWDRIIRDPVLPVGKAGAWDDGTLYTASNILTTSKEVILYYGAMNLPHGGSASGQEQHANIARAVWRTDGFISLHNAGDDAGIITTKSLRFDAKDLKVNAKVGAGGFLKVEVLDLNGSVFEGFTLQQSKPIIGDQYKAQVSWMSNGNLAKLIGREVKLRFHLKKGDLFSFWFE